MAFHESHDANSEKIDKGSGCCDSLKSVRYRQFFEQSPDAILIVDESRIIDANQAAARMAGMDVSRLIGLDISSFYVDVSDLDRIRQLCLEPGSIQDYLVNLVMPNGREFRCKLTGSATVNPDGTLSSQTIIRDVTEQMKAEAEWSDTEARFRRLARQNEVLASIGQIVSSTMDIEKVFDRFVDEMGSLVQCDATVIGLVDSDAQTITPKYQIGDPNPDWKVAKPVPLAGTMMEQVIGRGKTISGTGEALEIDPDNLREGDRIKSMLMAPLKLNDEVFGLLSLFCFEPNAYTKDDEDFVELVADQIAGTVANAQLYARLRDAEELQTHLAEESAIMAEVGRVVSSSLEFNDVYERFAELVRFLVPFDRIAISLVDLDLGRATVAYSAGMEHPVHGSGKAPIDLGSVSDEVTRNRKGVLVQGEDWTGQSGVLKEGSTTFRSVITVPLIADTSVIGLMFVSSVEEDAYTLRDLEVVQRVGDQIAGALAITQLHAQQSETENLLRASASQVRQQAAELSYINSDLVKANQTKSEFLSNMSHELRTPLNAVLGFADLLTEPVFGSLSERQSRFVENITTAGNQLLRLINDTLELSKIQDGLLKLMVEDVNVETCLDYCVKSIRNKRSDVTVSMQVDMPEGRVFYGDKRRLTQIVLCLLENAVKFSPADSHVELRASTSDDALHISVTDRGMGIHERFHKRIFDLFDQGHPDVGKKYGGSGLGLALVKHLVDLHEGHVDVESSEGRGSVFTVRLPFRHNVKTDEAAPPATVWSGPVDMADAWSIC